MLDRMILESSTAKLRQYSSRIQDCLGKLTYQQIWTRGGESQNSIGNLVLHLCGNLRQWIGYGMAGMPDIRVRDQEFATREGIQAEELRERLDTAVKEACGILENLPAGRLTERIVVQKYDVTILAGILHVVNHFAEHTGQIIFMAKLLTGADLGFYRHLQQPAHGEKTP